MSITHPMPEQMTHPSWPTPASAVRCVAEVAINAIASTIVRRAVMRARRELVALDDRTLSDIGLVRSELTSLLAAIAER
ncbi:DUF1127 domain-containing protein [Leptospira interrogans]